MPESMLARWPNALQWNRSSVASLIAPLTRVRLFRDALLALSMALCLLSMYTCLNALNDERGAFNPVTKSSNNHCSGRPRPVRLLD